MSKRQGSIASSTQATEFLALRTAAEESQSLRYMLRFLGYNVPSDGSCPTRIFGDSLSVILNTQNSAVDLSNKHVTISFYIVREAVTAGIIEPYWLNRTFNMSDIMPKKIVFTDFKEYGNCIYWRLDFHILSNNRLDDSNMDTH